MCTTHLSRNCDSKRSRVPVSEQLWEDISTLNRLRGRVFTEICDNTNLVFLQDIDSPHTYLHPSNNGLLRPDLSLVSADIQSQSQVRVDVLEDVGTDLLPLPVSINLGKLKAKTLCPIRKWVIDKANWDLFRAASDAALDSVDVRGH